MPIIEVRGYNIPRWNRAIMEHAVQHNQTKTLAFIASQLGVSVPYLKREMLKYRMRHPKLRPVRVAQNDGFSLEERRTLIHTRIRLAHQGGNQQSYIPKHWGNMRLVKNVLDKITKNATITKDPNGFRIVFT